MNRITKNLCFLGIVLIMGSCSTINPSIMFRTPKGYPYAGSIDTTVGEYKIAPFDLIDFRIYTNDGFKLIDISNTVISNYSNAQYVVEHDGNVKLPVVGRVFLKDLTTRQAELLLEEKYSAYYKNPFVLLKVSNRRVFIFSGSGGSGTVITLENDKTSLIEGLAKAGGLAYTGKSRKIKLIRNAPAGGRQVFLIDLSTIEGVKQADMVLQSNDIIYVEPVRKISQGVLSEISPIIGILTSTLFIYSLFRK